MVSKVLNSDFKVKGSGPSLVIVLFSYKKNHSTSFLSNRVNIAASNPAKILHTIQQKGRIIIRICFMLWRFECRPFCQVI